MKLNNEVRSMRKMKLILHFGPPGFYPVIGNFLFNFNKTREDRLDIDQLRLHNHLFSVPIV